MDIIDPALSTTEEGSDFFTCNESIWTASSSIVPTTPSLSSSSSTSDETSTPHHRTSTCKPPPPSPFSDLEPESSSIPCLESHPSSSSSSSSSFFALNTFPNPIFTRLPMNKSKNKTSRDDELHPESRLYRIRNLHHQDRLEKESRDRLMMTLIRLLGEFSSWMKIKDQTCKLSFKSSFKIVELFLSSRFFGFCYLVLHTIGNSKTRF